MRLKLCFRQCAIACLSGSFFAISLASFNAAASGLQIAPVALTLQAEQRADGVWLSNTSDNAINAQVRVYRWTQDNFTDRLTPSRELVISPPMLQLAPGGRQLIRIIRTNPVPNTVEDAYRLVIDELPPAQALANKLQFVLRYSAPVFIQPAGSKNSSAQLQWRLQHVDGQTFLDVNNQGNNHAQLSTLTWINANGIRHVVSAGLLGYVLPGSTMRWILSPADNAAQRSGKVEVVVNGQEIVQDL